LIILLYLYCVDTQRIRIRKTSLYVNSLETRYRYLFWYFLNRGFFLILLS